VVDAATIANSKPHPEIFLTAAAHLNVAPGDCLGVEDAAAGVASIKDAGMTAVGVGDARVLARADYIIPSMDRFRLSDYM
jgi:beta-phosphoglucomutase-like phosphatase (HAD superfamily)